MLRMMIVVVSFGLLVSACASASAQLCERLDECNSLGGTSVDECTDTFEQRLDELTSAVRSDCESELGDCLDKESCNAFLSCQIPSCPSSSSGD